jgi:hypothetical protein
MGLDSDNVLSFSVAGAPACTNATCAAQNAICTQTVPVAAPATAYVSNADIATANSVVKATSVAAGNVCVVYSSPCTATTLAADKCPLLGATYVYRVH